MSIKDSVLKFMRPIIAPYTTPRGAAAGIVGLINPAAGALVRYGPDILSAMGSASSGQGAEQSGSRSRSRGMSGMMPLSGGSGRGYGVGGGGGLPLSDLSQYFQRGRALDDSDMREKMPTMNQGGLVQQGTKPVMPSPAIKNYVPPDFNPMRPSGPTGLGLLNMGPRSGGRRQDLPSIGRFERRPEARADMLSEMLSQLASFSRPPSEPMDMNQGGLVQQVIADRQRVLDSFTPNPYDQYQYLMENPATRQAPTDDEVITGELSPATPTDPNEGRLSFDDFRGQNPNPPAMSALEARIAELMENRGMTQQEAAANQAFAAQQGADLNNDGAVTNAEYAEFMRAQEPTVSTMPVGPMVPLVPNQIGGGFLSGLNTDAIQQAIEEYKASMGDRSGGVDAPAVTPTIPDNLQDRIAALTGGAGTFGGMTPNIDVARLRELMAELYGGQTPPVRGPEFRPPPPRRIMVDPRMSEGMR